MGNRQTEVFSIRVTPEEHDWYREEARDLGVSVNRWIRSTLAAEAEIGRARRLREWSERVERERLRSVMGGGE